MAEYDNTNSGAVFKPFETMKMILQGKVNLEGNERKIVLVADKTKQDKKIRLHKEKYWDAKRRSFNSGSIQPIDKNKIQNIKEILFLIIY